MEPEPAAGDKEQLLAWQSTSPLPTFSLTTASEPQINDYDNQNEEEEQDDEDDCDQLAESPPLPPPYENTPHPIYAIMCACWATKPEDRPQFDEIANRLYWCLQMPAVLDTVLPRF